VSVCVGSAWKIPVPCGAGDKQGKAGQGQGRAGHSDQGNRCGGPRKVPFLLKKSLGKTEGLASNQQKYNFFKKLFSL